jgi:hypothetical protein
VNFDELIQTVNDGGFTRLANPLEDLFLREMPDPYYRFWRCVWRKTIGWQQTAAFISNRDLAESARIRKADVGRCAHVCQLGGILAYVPGRKGHENSHFTVLPNGLPDKEGMSSLSDLFAAVKQVTGEESRYRAVCRNRNYRFTNKEFCARVKWWVSMDMTMDEKDIDAYHAVHPVEYRRPGTKGLSVPPGGTLGPESEE